MLKLNEPFQVDSSSPFFSPGQILLHKRYNYRAVVVEYDLTFEASDSWYYSNNTQPRKNQPWYHLLVHDRDHATYAAEENLELEENEQPINHPLLNHFFTDFENGRYIRNDLGWKEFWNGLC
ncbi:MAG: heat shock protein HspQ [Verrucomicrobiota bacterium]